MSLSADFPAMRPTLLLNFARARQLDPRITFTRATTATYFDSSGVLQTAIAGQPRFDFNPTTGESLGLLVEEQRTNLFIRSEEFDTWALTDATIVANTIVAPDGTLTGDKQVEDATTGGHVVAKAVSVTSGTTYTFSYYAKKAERTQCGLVFALGGFGTTTTDIFDLDAGTVLTNSSGTAAITSVGNGWYRVSATRTATATASSSFQIRTASGGTASYPGDGTSGIFIWGAQLEEGAFLTSYIATTVAAATRNADAASMTGTNFSSWYNATEGTLYGESSTYDVSLARLSFSVTDGSTSNRIHVGHGANPKGFIANGGVTQLTINIPSVVYTNNTFSKTILVYANNNGNTAANGTTGVDDTSLSVPVVTQANIGNLTPTNSLLNGTIRKIAYYPVRLSNAQLQALTS